jgi:MoaA/NifB/PqqE/SkfB family radical SAM enzyme
MLLNSSFNASPNILRKSLFVFRNKLWRLNSFNMIETGEALPPTKLIIEATLRCNLKCRFCFRDQSSVKELTTDEIKKIINNAGDSVKKIGLTGGEVFMRPDIFKILDFLREHKLFVGILTNATLLTKEMIDRLVMYDNLNLGISMDGLEHTHNNIRRHPKAFQRTLNNIKLINKRIRVGVNTVITKDNIDEIVPLFSIIAPYITNYSVEFEMFNSIPEIEGSARFLKVPRAKIVNWIVDRAGYDYPKEKIKTMCKKINLVTQKKGISFNIEPQVVDPFFDEFYYGKILVKQPICSHLRTARSDPKGNLVFCHLIKNEFGNLIETPLPLLWNSEDIKAVRRRLLAKYMPPVCKRCCRLD